MSADGIRDNSQRYGIVSRALHWVMAALFIWMFASAAMRRFEVENAFADLLWSYHFSIGFTIFLLALARVVWTLVNMRNRPAHAGILGRAAAVGHLAIYLLMLAIPGVAILRAYGGGRGLEVFGLQVLPATGIRDVALTAPASATHGAMGWLLLVLVLGHVAMALVHRFAWKDDVLARMAPHPRRERRDPTTRIG